MEAQDPFLHKFQIHKSAVTALAFSKDGNYIATGSDDTNIGLFGLVDSRPLFKFVGHKDRVVDLDWLGQSRLITASKDGSMKVWNVQTQICEQSLIDTDAQLVCFQRVHDLMIVGTSDENVLVYRVDGHKLEMKGKLVKKTANSTVSINFTANLILVCSKKGKFEVFKYQDIDGVQKKLLRQAKRKAKKVRTAEEMEGEVEVPAESKINKTEILEKVKNLDFDHSLHFQSYVDHELGHTKIRHSIVRGNKLYLALHQNQICVLSVKKEDSTVAESY